MAWNQRRRVVRILQWRPELTNKFRSTTQNNPTCTCILHQLMNRVGCSDMREPLPEPKGLVFLLLPCTLGCSTAGPAASTHHYHTTVTFSLASQITAKNLTCIACMHLNSLASLNDRVSCIGTGTVHGYRYFIYIGCLTSFRHSR